MFFRDHKRSILSLILVLILIVVQGHKHYKDHQSTTQQVDLFNTANMSTEQT